MLKFISLNLNNTFTTPPGIVLSHTSKVFLRQFCETNVRINLVESNSQHDLEFKYFVSDFTSIAKRLSNPFTLVGTLVNF